MTLLHFSEYTFSRGPHPKLTRDPQVTTLQFSHSPNTCLFFFSFSFLFGQPMVLKSDQSHRCSLNPLCQGGIQPASWPCRDITDPLRHSRNPPAPTHLLFHGLFCQVSLAMLCLCHHPCFRESSRGLFFSEKGKTVETLIKPTWGGSRFCRA